MSKKAIEHLITSYGILLIQDGVISKEEIIGMLKLEPYIDEYKTEEKLSIIAERILKETKIKQDSMTKKRLKERMNLYNQGLSDVEIAEIQKVNPTAIWHWREKRELIANKSYEDVKKERLKLYKLGLTDKEIAFKLHETPTAIGSWRIKEGLEPNKKAKQQNEPVMDKRIRLFAENWTYQQIADEEGINKRSIQDWFYRQGITKKDKLCL